jgi:integrase
MGRDVNRLTALEVDKKTAKGRYADGGGLYFNCDGGRRSWLFKYQRDGKRREMGLGAYPQVSLKQARKLATEARALLAVGRDPLDDRRSDIRAAKPDRMTFDQMAAQYIAAHQAEWCNGKHRQQWRNTLATYASPVIGHMDVATIEARHVLQVLMPIWTAKPETAGRVRGRIEAILSACKAAGLRSGENPAAWKDNLKHLLPSHEKIQVVKHHAAPAWQAMPALYARLCERDALAAQALRLAILTAARSGEVLGAPWTEFDLKAKVWIVPAPRMKGKKTHAVPLSNEAIAVLASVLRTSNPYVFFGEIPGKPLSGMSMEMLLRRLDEPYTPHGTARATFKSWAFDAGRYPREVVEMAMAHGPEDKTEAAYLRSSAFDLRRKLVNDWAEFLLG